MFKNDIVEIGSLFPVCKDIRIKENYHNIKKDIYYYSLCREALYEIADTIKCATKVALLPAYICQSVVIPFIQAGYKVIYYSIGRNLRIDTNGFMRIVDECHPSIVLFHLYYGQKLNNDEELLLKYSKGKSAITIVDTSQSVFSSFQSEFVDYYVGSLRKWFPIFDGAFLKANKGVRKEITNMTENNEFINKQSESMYLRYDYFLSFDKKIKEKSRELQAEAAEKANMEIVPHVMSKKSREIFNSLDMDYIQRIRYKNYCFLYRNIWESHNVKKVMENILSTSSVPLYFPVYIRNRDVLVKELYKKAVYAPILWPVVTKEKLVSEDVKYIYDHILAIPCDQRYNQCDMERILEILNSY